jgi:hypothetical protein
MNVFILSTGRCGSTTFIRACRHITNYSSGHETRWGRLGTAHFDYPRGHIEADNRLSWFLGRLERAYGNDAFYVHLKRNAVDTARSFTRRFDMGIIGAYRQSVLAGNADQADALEIALDYCDTVNSNIEFFLKDKPRQMTFSLEGAGHDFPEFWSLIEAEGDLDGALKEWRIAHNASRELDRPAGHRGPAARIASKLKRIAKTLPDYLARV